ncbi:MAG: hypothetical protein ACLFVT_06995 [Syntrophobacteria bacterium]
MQEQAKIEPTCSTIQEKIQKAHRLYAAWGESLRRDPSIEPLLQRLRRNIEATCQTMLALGVVAQCKHCEEEEGGSCCGSGIENRYDPLLLLINLLLGVSLPAQPEHQNSCFFLGQNGCILMARHVLCVNYLCAKIQQKLSRDELIRLQTSAGQELDTEFLLYEAIKKKLRHAI